MTVTRFAPSPTGELHLGHALAALTAWREAENDPNGGRFLLRLEDIDFTRCRDEWITGIFDDLKWLGLSWPEPVWRQSDRFPVYREALKKLRTLGVLYPCFCTRQEIAAAASAPQGPDGPVYPGICRDLTIMQREDRIAAGKSFAWRLDTARALTLTGPLSWHDRRFGSQRANPALLGDVVLARKDIAASYHLAVTVDDAAQEITLVTRGEDLFSSTHIHRLLQALLDFPVPEWLHHRLICDDQGRRLAKRDKDRSLLSLRNQGIILESVLSHLPYAAIENHP